MSYKSSAAFAACVFVSFVSSAKGGDSDKPGESFHGPLKYDCASMPGTDHVLPDDPLLESLAWLVEHREEPAVGRAILAQAAAVDPESLDLETRLLAQNLLYRIAESSGDRVAAKLVMKYAVPADVFDAIGVEPDPAIEAWLGPREAWMERVTQFCGNGTLLVHDRVLEGAVAFRPVRNGELRGLVGQIIAFDVTGKAHVTPIVERVEMRRGLAVDAPACVAHLDLGAAGAPRIVPNVASLHHDNFVFPMGEGVGCTGCHSRNDVFGAADVPDARAAQDLLDARRGRVEELATKRLQSVLEVR